MAESYVRKKLVTLCTQLDVMLIPYPQNGRGFKGYPDSIAHTRDGRTFLVESKDKGKELRPDQIVVRDKLLQRGLTYFVYRGTKEDNQNIIDFVNGVKNE